MAAEKAELKERILQGTIVVFNAFGLKFTMDELATQLGMSKKTIYTVFPDKETMFMEMVDWCFDSIKQSEREIYEDPELDIVEKIRRILVVLPTRYQSIDFRKLQRLRVDFPQIYKKVEERIETDWEMTLALLEQGIAIGRIRPISLPVFKLMVESTIESFLNREDLIEQDISYVDALHELVEVALVGIEKRN